VLLARLPDSSDRALTPGVAPIREVMLRGRRDLIERHHLLRELSYLRHQLRSDVIRDESQLRLPTVRVSLHDWSHPAADVRSFDRLFESMQREGECCLVLWCTDWLAGSQSAVELLNRYQRLLPLPSAAVVAPELDMALRAYHALFPLHDVASRERHEVGLDTWRWLLRLTPRAGLELQLAALFHDLALAQLETTLQQLPLQRYARLRVVELSLFYDVPGRDPELAQLRAARTLSFLSLESWRFERRYGSHAARAKAEQLLLRLDSAALCAAAMTRQPRVVSDVLDAMLLANAGGGCASVSPVARSRLHGKA
jgi:hypothetical protein